MFDLLNDPVLFVIWAVALITAITIHEFAHAWAATQLGDPTPKLQGRLTLNPLAHLDPLGTLMLFFIRFGWGKPVQFDPYNLKHPRRDAAVISLAGPVSNIILAAILSLLSRFVPLASLIAIPVISLNVALAVFNLIPIHPLDGGKILIGLLPPSTAREIDLFLKQYGFLLLLFILLPFFGSAPLVHRVISPVINLILRFLIPTSSFGFI